MQLTEVQAEAEAYRQGADRPLGGYLALMGGYAGSVGAALALLRRSGRSLPETLTVADLVLLSVATHKASRIIAKDPITSPLRAPFTVFRGRSGESELAEEPRHGHRHSLGELMTCPLCVDQWVATAFAFGLVLSPRATRFVAGIFAVRAGADVLQFGYDALQSSVSD